MGKHLVKQINRGLVVLRRLPGRLPQLLRRRRAALAHRLQLARRPGGSRADGTQLGARLLAALGGHHYGKFQITGRGHQDSAVLLRMGNAAYSMALIFW